MKYKSFITFIAASLITSACTNPEEIISGNDTPPKGALPSAEFTLNSLPDGPYAEDAIRIEATSEDAPFYSIELIPDGHYLLSTHRPNYSQAATVGVTTNAKGGFTITKKHKDCSARTRSVEDNNGTTYLPNGDYYGEFIKIGDKKYRLSNGVEIDLMGVTDSDKKVTFKNADGSVSNVYVNVSESVSDDATESLCHTWNCDSFELWAYMNGLYIAHGKQTLKNGMVETYFKSIESDFFEEEDLKYDLLGEDSDYCHTVIFTSKGTYICLYMDGEAEVARWQWVDDDKGIFHYEDYEYNECYDDEWDGYVTTRFAGNQMRIYEDYTDSEDGVDSRIVAVNTFTVIK